jgi:hypothetical protein
MNPSISNKVNDFTGKSEWIELTTTTSCTSHYQPLFCHTLLPTFLLNYYNNVLNQPINQNFNILL